MKPLVKISVNGRELLCRSGSGLPSVPQTEDERVWISSKEWLTARVDGERCAEASRTGEGLFFRSDALSSCFSGFSRVSSEKSWC